MTSHNKPSPSPFFLKHVINEFFTLNMELMKLLEMTDSFFVLCCLIKMKDTIDSELKRITIIKDDDELKRFLKVFRK